MNPALKVGDWLTILVGIMAVAYLFITMWGTGKGTSLIIRSGGMIVAETDLTQNQNFKIDGPLGTTLIAVENRRVRVVRDPSPRQYCVKQGWLSRAGETALCLPNQVSVELTGAARAYDTLSY